MLRIGDGSSDVCVSERADDVCAKRRLITHCRDAGIPHSAITTFHDATTLLPQLLDGTLLSPSLPHLLATA